MGKPRILILAATAVASTVLLGLTTGPPSQSVAVAASSALLAQDANAAAASGYSTSQHCTETDGFRGADTEMCVELDYIPDGFNDGGYTPLELRVRYGAPQWLIGYDYQVGIPNFRGCDVNVQMYTHDNGTPQEVAASRSYTCASMQTSQSPYESPDGPEDEDLDAAAYSSAVTGFQPVAVAALASDNDPQFREIDVSAYVESNYLAMILPAGQYCVSIWVVTQLENDASRNNPACFTLGG